MVIEILWKFGKPAQMLDADLKNVHPSNIVIIITVLSLTGERKGSG